jgi:hypothetical protein
MKMSSSGAKSGREQVQQKSSLIQSSRQHGRSSSRGKHFVTQAHKSAVGFPAKPVVGGGRETFNIVLSSSRAASAGAKVKSQHSRGHHMSRLSLITMATGAALQVGTAVHAQ